MSLLDGLKRKKTKPVRADLMDVPTLFGGVGNASQSAEKRISVLSAAGGKPAKPRHVAKKSGRMVRSGFVVLLVGIVMVAGIWQFGVVEHPAAVVNKFDTRPQAGFNPSDESASTHAVRTQISTVTLPATAVASEPGGAPPAQAAQIEKVMLLDAAESRALESAPPPVGAIEAALNTPAPVETAALPTPVVTAVRPSSKTPDTKTVSPRTPPPSTQVPASPKKDKDVVAAKKPVKRKPQVARSKEPDPDAQLLEALLVHLRKNEAAKEGAH